MKRDDNNNLIDVVFSLLVEVVVNNVDITFAGIPASAVAWFLVVLIFTKRS